MLVRLLANVFPCREQDSKTRIFPYHKSVTDWLMGLTGDHPFKVMGKRAPMQGRAPIRGMHIGMHALALCFHGVHP